jgi:hypothetical protein
MTSAGGLNALRLLDGVGVSGRPSGMVLPRRAVPGLAARLAKRARHYPALRVTRTAEALVFWSVADEVSLPWVDDEPVYLAHAGKAVFFPAGKRVALPGRWAEGVLDRLAAAKALSRPILLLPEGETGGLRAVGLGRNSAPVPAVDWAELAGS